MKAIVNGAGIVVACVQQVDQITSTTVSSGARSWMQPVQVVDTSVDVTGLVYQGGIFAQALPSAIAAKLAALETYALALEQGGTTVGGQYWDTDDATQAKLNAAYNLARIGTQTSFTWWMSTGFITFTATQIETYAPAVGTWVEEVFANLGVHYAAISALTSTAAVTAYDFTTGWPQGT